MYSVIRTDTVDAQLNEILNYIADELVNVQAALDLVDEFERVIGQLKSFPHLGTEYEPAGELEVKFFYRMVNNYKMLYWIDEKKEEVYISYIFHSRQNFKI